MAVSKLCLIPITAAAATACLPHCLTAPAALASEVLPKNCQGISELKGDEDMSLHTGNEFYL